MRIAYVCADPGIPVFGSKGASVHVQGMLGALVRAGATVELLATSTGQPHGAIQGVRLHRLPPVPDGELAGRERAALDANEGLRAELLRLGRLDLVYERYSLWSNAAMEHAHVAGIPGVLEVNAPLIEEQSAYRGLVDRAAAEEVLRRAATAASVVIAVSPVLERYLERAVGAGEKVHVIPNGVDPRRFARPVQAAARRTGFTVGFVGTLKPWHDLATLVEAFAAVAADSQARLVVVGDGPKRDWLGQQLSRRGLARAATLTGPVAPWEVPAHLARMDVGVAPYPDLRPFYFSPLKVFEYMAAGLPVVATRTGELARLIDHGRTGLLCPPGDAPALAAALRRLRDDPRLRARLGRAARRVVLERHTWDAIARRVAELAGVAGGGRREAA